MSLQDVKRADFNVSKGYFIYPCDSTDGPIIATLPADPYLEEIHTFKDVTGAASTNPIGLDGNGNLIDGLDSLPDFIQVADGWGTVQWTGSSWSVLG